MFVEAGWSMLKTVPCLAYHPEWDCLPSFHGDDFYTEGETSDLDKVDDMICTTFKAKILPRIGPQACSEGSVLRRKLFWNETVFPAARSQALRVLGRAPKSCWSQAFPDALVEVDRSWCT